AAAGAARGGLCEDLTRRGRAGGRIYIISTRGVGEGGECCEAGGRGQLPGGGTPPPMDMGGEQVVLRPSLCPHHAVIYRARGRSYRELPLRLGEIGGQYRAELSGVLGGLSRVRAMQLNDAHVFCTVDQAADEALAALRMIARAYRALGIEPVRYRLSLPGPGGKYVDDPNLWQ